MENKLLWMLCLIKLCCLVLYSLQSIHRILSRRFMGCHGKVTKVESVLSLLMGKVTLVSSRSGWSRVINDWHWGALTGFISSPVLPSNTWSVVWVLHGSELTQQPAAHVCVHRSHRHTQGCWRTQSLAWSMSMSCACVSKALCHSKTRGWFRAIMARL